MGLTFKPNRRTHRASVLSIASVVLAGLAFVVGCNAEDEERTRTSDCENDRQIGGSCAGLRARSCTGDACVTGATCASKKNVAQGADLASAAVDATSGTCLVLAAGTYGDVSLPPGVSLIGVGASAVRIGHVTMNGGEGASIRGLTSIGGIEVKGAQAAKIESVRVESSPREGVRATDRSSLSIRGAEIVGSALQGVLAIDDANVEIEESVVEKSQGAGVWLECSAGCACADETKATLKRVIVRGNGVIGVAALGVRATLDTVDVREQVIGSNLRPAGGIAAWKCANISASAVRVIENTSFGILIDGAQATLGESGSERGVEVSRNVLGVWVQNTDPLGRQPFVLENGNLHDNEGVGFGVAPFTGSVVVRSSEITATRASVVPTLSNGIAGAEEVGDGVTWGSEALVRLEGVRMSKNHRASILIDGSVAKGSAILRTTLVDGDDLKGVLQQRFPVDGISPDKDDQLPAPQREAREVFAVASAPTVPAR